MGSVQRYWILAKKKKVNCPYKILDIGMHLEEVAEHIYASL